MIGFRRVLRISKCYLRLIFAGTQLPDMSTRADNNIHEGNTSKALIMLHNEGSQTALQLGRAGLVSRRHD